MTDINWAIKTLFNVYNKQTFMQSLEIPAPFWLVSVVIKCNLGAILRWSVQAQIHTDFHRFTKIGQIFDNKYIFNNKKLSELYSDLSPSCTNWIPTRIQIAIVLNQGAKWTRLETICTRLLRSRRRKKKERCPLQQENPPQQAKLKTRWFWCGGVDCGQQAI